MANLATLAPAWKPGQASANPGGKPVGSRNRLQGAFVKALADEFDKNGRKAIARCCADDPATFLKVIVALMPKELELVRPLRNLTDDELHAAVAELRSALLAGGAGTRSGATIEGESSSALPAVPEAD